MTRSLQFRIVLVAILFAIAGGLITRKLLFPPKPALDNGLWIAAVAESPAPPVSSRSNAEYLAAQADAISLQQRLESAKHSIEEAIQMVKEQRDNFDFAEERYNRLMPLVEQGTLDLMTASQIQSAYISARASLSQAKFYLTQAQQAYGTPETRKILIAAAQSKVEAAKPAATRAQDPAPAAGQIIAEIPEGFRDKIQPGTSAQVSLNAKEFPAIVRRVDSNFAILEPATAPTDLPPIARCTVVYISPP